MTPSTNQHPATDLQPLWENDKGFFNTVSRKKFNLLKPDTAQIRIEDIALPLCNICRFGGQIKEFYSVAQHSYLVWCLAPVQLKKAALLHDASEAYVGDVVKPLKNLIGEPYATIEYNLMATIGLKYGLTHEDFDAVKAYDRLAVEMEFEYFFQDKIDRFEGYFNCHENTCWAPADALTMFMWAYQQTFEQ